MVVVSTLDAQCTWIRKLLAANGTYINHRCPVQVDMAVEQKLNPEQGHPIHNGILSVSPDWLTVSHTPSVLFVHLFHNV